MYSEKKVNEIIETIRRTSAPNAIYIFGSYAKRTANDNSDLDVAIIKNAVKDKHKELLAIRKALFENYVPMDLLMMNEEQYQSGINVRGTVQYEINKFGIKVYEKLGSGPPKSP